MAKTTKKMSLNQQRKILAEVKATAFQVGEFLVKKQRQLSRLKVSYKEAQGLVSNADIEAEKKIIKALTVILPEAKFLAEESAFKSFGNETSAYHQFKKEELSWIIDPLDGTTNFLSGMDYYAICICLAHYGSPLLSVIYRPSTNEMYYAVKGRGSFKESGNKRRRLNLSLEKKNLNDCLLVTGFAGEKGELFDQEFAQFKSLMGASRGIRRMGSAALDICLTSEGIFDGFWERGLAPWDVAAASLIHQEAGGKVTDFHGRKFNPFQESILCAQSSIHSQMKGHLNS